MAYIPKFCCKCFCDHGATLGCPAGWLVCSLIHPFIIAYLFNLFPYT